MVLPEDIYSYIKKEESFYLVIICLCICLPNHGMAESIKVFD